ncbi:MAG: S8/S53 family peptidase [Opitutaceae bacterium]
MDPAQQGEVGREVGLAHPEIPYHPVCFAQIRVGETWKAYQGRLTWGKGQCLAILDDGCDLGDPAWCVRFPWGPKVVAGYDSIEGSDDPSPVPPGYHGTSVGYPSSLNLDGVCGIACNNHVAQVRCVSVVHLQGRSESPSIGAALRWVLDHRERLRITAVNLSVLDDEAHDRLVPTEIDEVLASLRTAGVWVGAPCGNHDFARGVSWPACQPDCFGIGATVPGQPGTVHLDRGPGTDLLVAAEATSSANAFAAASSMVLREAIETVNFDWRSLGPTLPEAILEVFCRTGRNVSDPVTGRSYRELDLKAAVDHILDEPR